MEDAAPLSAKDDVASADRKAFLPRYRSPKEADDRVTDQPITNTDINSNHHPHFPAIYPLLFNADKLFDEMSERMKLFDLIIWAVLGGLNG